MKARDREFLEKQAALLEEYNMVLSSVDDIVENDSDHEHDIRIDCQYPEIRTICTVLSVTPEQITEALERSDDDG